MFLLFIFNTFASEGKCEFSTGTDEKNWVIKSLRWQHVNQGYTKTMMNVLIAGVCVDQRKSDWIFFVLVYPGVQRRDIYTFNDFSFFRFDIEAGSTCSSSKERISRVKWLYKLRGLEKFLQLRVCFLVLVKRTLPLFNDGITGPSKHFSFSLCGFVHFLNCSV